jgi:hypothetical protein
VITGAGVLSSGSVLTGTYLLHVEKDLSGLELGAGGFRIPPNKILHHGIKAYCYYYLLGKSSLVLSCFRTSLATSRWELQHQEARVHMRGKVRKLFVSSLCLCVCVHHV